MKKLIILLIVFTAFAYRDELNLKSKIDHDLIFIESIINKYDVPHKKRIAKCIRINAYKYNHPIKLFVGICEAESEFDWKAINFNNTCFGLYQVNVDFHKDKVYKARNGRYKKLLKKHKGTNIINVLKYIGVNTEVGGKVLKDYRDEANGCYTQAVSRFGGYTGKFKHKHEWRTNYLKKAFKYYIQE